MTPLPPVTPRSGPSGARAACLWLVAALAAGCAAGGSARPEPPPAPALEAYGRAVTEARALALGEREDAAGRAAALAEALEYAPGWIPAAREADELEREALRGHLAWARRRAAARRPDAGAAELYLLGRLEGADGLDELRAALRRDPDCAWAHHALSVDAELRGDLERALAAERAAEEVAASAYERAQFGLRAIDLERRLELDEVALEHAVGLADELAEELVPAAHLPLELAAAGAELESDDPARRERGLGRALALLATARLSDGELFGLLGRLERAAEGRSRSALTARVERALAAGPRSPSLDDPALLLGRDPSALRFALLGDVESPSPRRVLIAELAAGRAAEGARRWLALQPAVVLGPDGLPRDRRLRAWVELALEHERLDHAARTALAEALLEAGWQDAAQPLIEALAEAARAGAGPEVEVVAALDRRADAIQALVDELELLIAALYDGRRSLALTPALADAGGYAAKPNDTRGVLASVQRLLREHGPYAGLSADTIERIEASPLLRFGPFASVVVPGPRFGRRDALYGVGVPGEPVPGLAAAMDALGRFALFGAGVGRPADGTVLRRLWAEERSGSHLGVDWRGTLVWCAGAEADGARSRASGLVSGAALHEGYWIDVEAERARLARYRRLAARHLVGDGPPAPLAHAAPRLDDGLEGGARRAERRRLVPPLGQADRVALALLFERSLASPEADPGELVTLEDLLDVVETHEEGHLCDRTRFLPLGRDLLGALGLGLGEWLFGDLGLERRLEYRAQAVALACAAEPRLALIDLLDAAEVDQRLETVHARAYRALLARFLEELDAALAADPDRFPALDPDAYLLHQLERLSSEQVRAIGLAVAEAEGLAAD